MDTGPSVANRSLMSSGLAPSTSSQRISGGYCENLIPVAYAGHSVVTSNRRGSISPPYTSAGDVAEAVYAAATAGLDNLGYPADAGSLMLAELR